MTEQAEAFCRELFSNTPALKDLERDFREGVSLLCGCFQAGGKLLTCGNGGSAADSEHIVGELMKGFLQKMAYTLQTIILFSGLGLSGYEGEAETQTALSQNTISVMTFVIPPILVLISFLVFSKKYKLYGELADKVHAFVDARQANMEKEAN